jgi:nitroreductase
MIRRDTRPLSCATSIFFGAPLAGIVSMHRDLGPADAVSVGMYLQTPMLALTAQGLGTCVEVSVAGYPDVVRTELNSPPELTIICGLAVGYSDPDFLANKLHIGRDPAWNRIAIGFRSIHPTHWKGAA